VPPALQRGTTEIEIPIDQVRASEIVIVRPGEQIPVNGMHLISFRQIIWLRCGVLMAVPEVCPNIHSGKGHG
jgi:hypothetical protein